MKKRKKLRIILGFLVDWIIEKIYIGNLSEDRFEVCSLQGKTVKIDR